MYSNESHGDEHLEWCDCGCVSCQCDKMTEQLSNWQEDYFMEEPINYEQ